MATTKAKANTTTATDFPTLDEEPEFRKAQGRAKTPLRAAIESLELGKSIVASEDGLNDKVVNSIRQKAQAVRKASIADGSPKRFRTRVDLQNRVIVTRVEPVADNADDDS